MIPPGITAYLAKARREDLLGEAWQATIAAEAAGATSGWWDRVQRLVAHMFLEPGHWLHAHLCHRWLGRTAVAYHCARCAAPFRHQVNTGLCSVGYHGVSASGAVVAGQSGGHRRA